MSRMIKYPSINQYRQVVKEITERACFIGLDEEGKARFDYLKPKPVVDFSITTKIHRCFEKNTMVTLANGEDVKISELESGTYILSYNTGTNTQEIKQVKAVINQKLNKEWVKLTFDKTELICTKDHKIYTKNRGYVEAQHLTSEDIFETV